MLDPRLISFRPLTLADLSLEHHWLNRTPAVRDFCAEGQDTPFEQVVAKYGKRIRGESPTRCFIIQYGETPIGHIQTYRWRDYPDYARHLDLTEEAAGLDVWIGHADYLHRGLGRHILQAFLREIVFAEPDIQSCVITPEVRNASALRAYAKAGFVNLRTIAHPDEPGPVCVLRIGRGAVVNVQPRAVYLTEPMRLQELRPHPYSPTLLEQLPDEITALTGAIRSASLPAQGACNLLLRLQAERGTFALKVARGGYRSQELEAEHTVMQALHGGPVPVPMSLQFAPAGDLSFQLRTYCPGEPLTAVLATDETLRPEAVRQMGRTLAAIHAVRPAGAWTWEQWLDASLAQAARNLESGVCDDPEEFTPEAPAPAVLQWLKSNRPAGGNVCLLHGDYRPKNLLWHGGRVSAVIDWAFVDMGDPYYDLSIIRWYMRDDAEWQQFLDAYGIGTLD